MTALADLPEFSVVDTDEWTFVKRDDGVWQPVGWETFTLTSDELAQLHPEYKVKAIGIEEPAPEPEPAGPAPRNLDS
jgi:hypothetical protein